MTEEKLILNEKQLKMYSDTKKWIEGLPFTILNLVEDYDHVMMGNKTVVCTAILRSGFEITAYSAPVDLNDFNLELGRILAKRKVLEELMNLERYHKFNIDRVTINDTIIENDLGYEPV